MIALTPEERVRRVKAALAEAGYPGARVEWSDAYGQVAGTTRIPHDVWWRAIVIAGEAVRCWDCFSDCPTTPAVLAPDCDHDPVTSPWPELVR